MTITTITLNVARQIASPGSYLIVERFANTATENEYMMFSHTNFFYSFPEWDTRWLTGKEQQFHKINTQCLLCEWMPERNYAGYGNIYMLNNGICNDKILVFDGYEIIKGRKIPKKKWIPNTARLSRMILLCPTHIKGYFLWNEFATKNKPVQLTLF